MPQVNMALGGALWSPWSRRDYLALLDSISRAQFQRSEALVSGIRHVRNQHHWLSSNTIAGNYIGTNIAALPLRPTHWDQYLERRQQCHRGTTTADRNIISGNSDNGIVITSSADNTLIYGNYNRDGCHGKLRHSQYKQLAFMSGSSLGTRVGSGTTGAGNIISGNGNGITFDNADNSFIQATTWTCCRRIDGRRKRLEWYSDIGGQFRNLLFTNADGTNDTAELQRHLQQSQWDRDPLVPAATANNHLWKLYRYRCNRFVGPRKFDRRRAH